jgi:hypothetical protein
MELRKILSHRASSGDSIYSYFDEEHEEMLKIFTELLRKTFDREKDFEEYFKLLRLKMNVFTESSKFYNMFEMLSDSEWSVNDFEFYILNFNEIQPNFNETTQNINIEKLKKLFLSKNCNNETFLQRIAYDDDYHEMFGPIFKIFPSFFNKSELLALIENQDNHSDNNLLMNVAWKSNSNILKEFWDLIDKIFDHEKKLKILLTKNKFYESLLQFSTFNKDPNSFLFVKELYEKFFTQDQIREILKTFDEKVLPFTADLIYDASLETTLKVSEYLEDLFKNQKLELRRILSHRHESGNTIYSCNKGNKQSEEKLKIFVQLLRKTFGANQKEEFETVLSDLQTFSYASLVF